MVELSEQSLGITRTISDQMEEVAKEVLTPAKRTTIGRSASEQLDEATKEILIGRKSSAATIGRTTSYSELVPTPPIGCRKPPLARKMASSPRVSAHGPKWKSGQLRIEDELTNAFFEEVALSRASSATSHGLSFSIAGPVMAPNGDVGLIKDLQEARLHASIALRNKEKEPETDIEKNLKLDSDISPKGHPLPIYLKFVDVKYKVILQGKPISVFRSSLADSIFFEKDILHNVTGNVTPGEVLAMMGPSGCGKTTLINLLGGRMQHNVSGSITYNDQPYTKALKRRIGFVTQDDVLFPHLTVRETLIYAALLRLPRFLSKESKRQRAMEVIHELGLDRCRDTIIGGNLVRGVSGGERKRVCVGCEILIDPSLLFLDEPTSGLDSTTALRIVQMLKDIAKAGRTVVTTIHQPSSRLFHKFDKLILLGEGHPLYFGKASEAMTYFASIGFSPVITMNPADFMLDLANGNVCDMAIPAELQHRATVDSEGQDCNMESVKRIVPSPQNVLEYLIGAYETSLAKVENERLSKLSEASDELKHAIYEKREWGATWWEQFSILFIRGLKERRHEYLSCLRIAQVLCTAFLLGCLWWQSKKDTPKSLEDQTGLIFFIAVFWGFFPVFTAIFTFPQERAMLVKERSVDMYRLSAYFLARNLSDIPLDLFLPVIYLLIVYFMAHLRMTVQAFLLTVLTIFLSIVASQVQ
eukprot:TRINITY_DN5495_c0_g3_i3.p1 TRINITY_DN5495_c0_g3~~TRINITY_DN5495_c0_g3_i3.p1  ORF type:complete len:700 (-),score=99.66 TRINITY_DN5495_c0_g3_i3:995-3094(-)